MKIGEFEIGQERPVLMVAELSANHNHDKEIAIKTIRAAKKSGADAIKFQTYTPDTLTIDCNNEYFRIDHGTLWDGRNLYDLYKEAYTPWEWHPELFRVAREEGLLCFSTPFDSTAVDFLLELDTPAFKIASFEIQDVPLIKYAASKMKPMIISTGIASLEDIQLAVDTCAAVGNKEVILLKCTSSYPAPIDLANIRTMVDMEQRFKTPIGLSDHTEGDLVPVVATSLGARLIEKHFILDRELGGPDAEFSMTPKEFANMVARVREAEMAMGKVTYEVPEKVNRNRKFARSLFVVKDIKKGETFTVDNIRSIRPGYGLHPKYFDQIIGKTATEDLGRGTPLKLSDWQ